MKRQSGNQANNSCRNPGCNSYQIGIAQRLAACKTIQPPAHPFYNARITQSIKCSGMDACAKSLCRAQHTPVILKNLNRPVKTGTFAGNVFGWHDNKTYINSYL